MAHPAGGQTWRFGVFEVDLRSGELRKRGVRIALQGRPLQLLEALLSRPGDVITRDELRQTLWGDATFVDFEHSINNAVSKLRTALSDSGQNPRFIETLSRHGYRFIAPVQTQSAPVVSPHKIRLAVLPFENLSGDPAENYFSDGLTEEMIAQLGRMDPRRLGVVARTTAMHYKGTSLRLDQIGKELGVDYVLEGSVRRSAGRVRVTAQLIQIHDQMHLWAETYDRRLSSVLDIQRQVARKIARSMAVELLPAQQTALSKRATRNVAAHDAYLRGRYFWSRRTDEAFAKAVGYFEKAIREDPTYALAYAGLADCFDTLGLYGTIPPAVAREKARQAATKALEIDGKLAEAHAALAYAITLFEWEWTSAEREFRTAIECDPNYTTARHWYGHALAMLGRFQEALTQMHLALAIDPLSLVLNSHTGWILYFARQFDEARERLVKTREMDPGFALSSYFLGLTYLQVGGFDDAIEQFEAADRISPCHPGVLAGMGQALARKGDEAGARRFLEELSALSARRHVSPFFPACVHARLGATDAAMMCLEEAYGERCPWMAFLNVEPAVDTLRADARFQDLVERIGFP